MQVHLILPNPLMLDAADRLTKIAALLASAVDEVECLREHGPLWEHVAGEPDDEHARDAWAYAAVFGARLKRVAASVGSSLAALTRGPRDENDIGLTAMLMLISEGRPGERYC